MLEWMHDPEIQQGFKKNMLAATLDDAIHFCRNSVIRPLPRQGDSFHFAIVDETDEYLGTVSLKNIDLENGNAEYAVATRRSAQGKGIAFAATKLVLKKAFEDYGLHRVYLNVLPNNKKAIRLYERSGFQPEGEFREHLKMENQYVNWEWYGILESDYRRA